MIIRKFLKNYIPKKMLNSYRIKKMNSNFNKLTFNDAESLINDDYISNSKQGKSINWENPVLFNEKMNFSKLYNFTVLKSDLTDKYKVRDYVKNIIGEKHLIPLIGVYDSFSDINFDSLPKRFVMKCNHDSGSVTLVDDKNAIDINTLNTKYDFFLKRNFATVRFELHYSFIKPKIIIEKYIGCNINDYKFLCFDGKVALCWIDCDRFIKHKRNIYDSNWNLLDVKSIYFDKYDENIEKPKNFEKMVEIAEKLSKGFDQVRIDLYDDNENIYFGEMTFTSGGGVEDFEPYDWNEKIGKMWKIDLSNRKKLLNMKLRDGINNRH